ncbi:hypothetical protein CH92_01270 [Stutzerimonas stutzeri]|uniref:DUF4124 domain-containing protein n=1 Tax=Stutzerimonas stutzeri TaxID=316 RepID=W8R2Q4_STUST|nr:DUF4124 domain-containing protein [Stutzerimonas stutzeri]AHL73798.1 hypothetical protein CH92_01270 [Stutzerimonas stutzeri]MCQ4328686.1 DUF4124 domain-containing protein [Stutzerimonas stutzeri]
MRIALFSLLLLVTVPALAQIYKYTDEKGNTVFTNQPPEGVAADTVELPPANTVNIRTPEPPPPLESEQDHGQRQPYRSLSIGGIPDDEALRANNGTFVVSAQLDPQLKKGHQVRFLLDGVAQAAPGSTTSLQLNTVDRGTHTLEVEILSNGEVVQRAAEQFTVQRVNTSSPALRPKPAPQPKPKTTP